MSKNKPNTLQIESDKRLLEFGTFESYLNSLVNQRDLEYFQDTNVTRAIAELGFWSSGQTLDRKSFDIRSALAKEFFYPSFKPIKLASGGINNFPDPLLLELAKREKDNLEGNTLTIIFLRAQNSANFEVSSFIDFRHRLKKENWRKYFTGKELITPQSTDLSYFHWRNNNVFTTDTDNFAVTSHPIYGLGFFCKHDRRYLYVNPKQLAGPNSSRHSVETHQYEQAVLYDHCIMKRVNLT